MQENIIQSLLINIASDIFSWFLIAFMSVLIVRFLFIGHYHRIRKFFGLVGKSDRLIIYFSSLLTHGKLSDRYGKKYDLPVLTLVADEIETLSLLSRFIYTDPLRWLPDDSQKFFQGYWAFRPIEVAPVSSPLLETDLEFDSMLIIGGPLFNSASKYFQENGLSHLKFTNTSLSKENISIEVTKGKQKGQHLRVSRENHLGVIERIIDDEHHTTAIWIAGISSQDTKSTVQYFIQNQDNIIKKYSNANKPFAICVSLEADSKNRAMPNVIYRWPE